MKKFVALGGRLKRRNVKTLYELAEEGYDLIINCSGLGARKLVADETVTPIRGQVYRVTDFRIAMNCPPPSRRKVTAYLAIDRFVYDINDIITLLQCMYEHVHV